MSDSEKKARGESGKAVAVDPARLAAHTKAFLAQLAGEHRQQRARTTDATTTDGESSSSTTTKTHKTKRERREARRTKE